MTNPALEGQTLVTIDGATFVLPPDEDIDELQRRIQAAVEKPQFVGISTADGTDLRILMSADTRVTIAVVPPWAGTEALTIPDGDAADRFDY